MLTLEADGLPYFGGSLKTVYSFITIEIVY